ncbi:type II toxin-antitoxin system PemK/MazF family toxin [Micromonospora sp. DT233]|uniref:type II toxin-antitoxin system PemK/MazF family toxin n=1 Tax=Micromonospora sp. DT233 TaxID=3393432 RepID=UPI003CEB7647
MPDWLLWALAIVLAVAAGWAWSEWRRRAAGTGRARSDRSRPGRPRPRPGRSATRPDRDAGTRSTGAGTRGSDAGTRRPGRGADTRRPGRTAAPPRPRDGDRDTAGTPRPGEIWWADVPYADGSGSKVRPCLVLWADGRSAEVLKITSQDKSDRDDHVRIPTRDWDPDAEHDSYLDISEPIPVAASAFREQAGTCPTQLWRHLTALPHLPTS